MKSKDVREDVPITVTVKGETVRFWVSAKTGYQRYRVTVDAPGTANVTIPLASDEHAPMLCPCCKETVEWERIEAEEDTNTPGFVGWACGCGFERVDERSLR